MTDRIWDEEDKVFRNRAGDVVGYADDPRAKGFNYGAPSPVPAGYGIYDDAIRLADVLGDTAHQASQRAWKLEMAIRDVRHAVTREEREKAHDKLRTVYDDLKRFAPETGGDPSPDYSFDELASLNATPSELREALAAENKHAAQSDVPMRTSYRQWEKDVGID